MNGDDKVLGFDDDYPLQAGPVAHGERPDSDGDGMADNADSCPPVVGAKLFAG
jgi:hypothetical protein